MRDLHEPTTHAQLIDRLSEIQLSLAAITIAGKQKPTPRELSDYATTVSILLRSLEQACNSTSPLTT